VENSRTSLHNFKERQLGKGSEGAWRIIDDSCLEKYINWFLCFSQYVLSADEDVRGLSDSRWLTRIGGGLVPAGGEQTSPHCLFSDATSLLVS
jgi:hypothetical protein